MPPRKRQSIYVNEPNTDFRSVYNGLFGRSSCGWYDRPVKDATGNRVSVFHKVRVLHATRCYTLACCQLFSRPVHADGVLAARPLTCWRCLACPGCLVCRADYYDATPRCLVSVPNHRGQQAYLAQLPDAWLCYATRYNRRNVNVEAQICQEIALRRDLLQRG